MVYYEPNQRPWFNNPKLGPLRLLVSDEQAATLPRTFVFAIIKFILIGYGIALLLEKSFPIVLSVQGINISPLVAKYLDSIEDPDIIPYAGKYVDIVFIVMALIGGYKFLKYLYTKWKTHVKKLPASEIPSQFFWVSNANGDAPKGAKGVLFNRKLNKWMTEPVRTQEEGQARALNYDGMTLLDFIYTEFTIGWEYPLNAMIQCIKHYFWWPRWNMPIVDDSYRKTFYHGVINTAMACFIVDKDTEFVKNQRPDLKKYHGAAVFENVMLQFLQNSVRTFERIVIYLDHDTMEFVKMETVWVNYARETEHEIWGSKNVSENARPDLKLTANESMSEAAKVCVAIIADYTHGLVHMWANGTAINTPEQWALQKESNNVTQWMNSQAVYLSWLFIGDTQEVISQILTHNNGNGLNFHSTGKIAKLVGERSKFHQMSVNARRRIQEHIFHQSGKDSPNYPEVDGIIATTVWHSAEHYYTTRLFPKNGNIVPLKTDLSGVLMSIIAPIKYWTRSLLVRQHLDDPICKILYEEAVAVDPDFANNGLSIGCAY